MSDKNDVLRSIANALDVLPENRWYYLIGFAEGVIAGRQAQAGE